MVSVEKKKIMGWCDKKHMCGHSPEEAKKDLIEKVTFKVDGCNDIFKRALIAN